MITTELPRQCGQATTVGCRPGLARSDWAMSLTGEVLAPVYLSPRTSQSRPNVFWMEKKQIIATAKQSCSGQRW